MRSATFDPVRALAAVAAVLAGMGIARAEEIPRLYVVWEAPAGCPDREAFLAQLAGHLGGVAPASPMHVEVVVEPAERDLVLTMRTRTGASDGERQLRGRDCTVLAETAALTLALAIAPEAVKAGRRERGTDAEIPGGGRVDRPVVVGEAQGQEWGIPLSVRAGMAADVGGLPGFSPGVHVAAGTRIGQLVRLEAIGAYWFEKSTQSPDQPAIGLEISALTVGARLCLDLLRRRWLSGGLCGMAELIRTSAVATGVGGPERNGDFFYNAGGGLSLATRLTKSLQVRTDADFFGRGSRPTYHTDDVPPIVIYRPEWVGFRAGLGVEAYFP